MPNPLSTIKPQKIMDFFTVKKPPYTPLLWKILVQVPQPPEKIGSFYVPDSTRDENEFGCYVGYVAAVGQFAYTAVTKAGIDMNEMERKPSRGDWVIFGRHAGEKIKTKDGTLWIKMADTEIDGIVQDPDVFDCIRL